MVEVEAVAIIINHHLAEEEVITMNHHQEEVAIIINHQVEVEVTPNPIQGAVMTSSNLNLQSLLIDCHNKALIKIPMIYKTIINFQIFIKADNRTKTPVLRKDSKIKNSSSQCDSIEEVELCPVLLYVGLGV